MSTVLVDDVKETDIFKVVGKRIPLKEAAERVSGKALFTGDIELPGMLHAKILRSPFAHARVVRVDTRQAEKLPGVKAILTKDNAPRKKVPVSQYVPPDKVVFDDKVRFIGDEVAAVAAVSKAVAESALKLIKVEYEELPAVIDPEEAIKPGAPLIHDDKEGNSAGIIEMSEGDIEVGFQEADYILEETFRTPSQRHAPMETHCAVASFDAAGKLTVWTPSQLPFKLQEMLAEYLEIPMSMVRVIKPHLGGGFGGKLDMFVEHICALLSGMTGRPVKCILTREEEFTVTVSRHAYVIRLKVGFKKDGTLTAIHARAISNEGAYLYKPGPSGLAGRGMVKSYRCPHTKYEGYRVYTNQTSGGAFRGYGNVQGHFAIESMVDRIAEKLGIDPVDYRLKNHRQQGDKNFADLPIVSCGLAECFVKGKELIGWERRQKTGAGDGLRKRGIGVACGIHGTGPSFALPSYSAASIRINSDGSAHLLIGTADLGTGSNTTLAQIAAEELGISADDIDIISGDTSASCFDEGAFASMTLYNGGNAVRAAAAEVKRKIMLRAAAKLEVVPEDLEYQDGRFYIKMAPEKGITFIEIAREASKAKKDNVAFLGEANFVNITHPPSFAAHFAEVEIDTETGQVEILKYVAIQDSGRIINPLVVEGQVEGALQQGIGLALTENPVIDKSTGKMLNPSFHNYMVLTALDMPETKVSMVETYEPSGPFGAKGVAEMCIDCIAPTITNAIYNAIGIRFNEIPVTSEKVFKALKGLSGQ